MYLLNTLHQDKIGDYIKTDKIILMIGNRSFSALKKKRQENRQVNMSGHACYQQQKYAWYLGTSMQRRVRLSCRKN